MIEAMFGFFPKLTRYHIGFRQLKLLQLLFLQMLIVLDQDQVMVTLKVLTQIMTKRCL